MLRPLEIFFGHFGIFCGHLVYFVVIWDSLWSFGIFCGHLVYFVVIWYIFPLLVCCTKKNLATLLCGICDCEIVGFDPPGPNPTTSEFTTSTPAL
jgi:hypothetical protein